MPNGTQWWIEKAKERMGAQRAYKGEYKQPVVKPAPQTVKEAQGWLEKYSQSFLKGEVEKEAKERQAQRQAEYEARRAEYARQLPTKTIEPIDTIIYNSVPGYMKQVIPPDYFKQFEPEQIPFVVETLNWGLFGDPKSGGKWTGGKTETYWRALRGEITPDEIYFRGYMNQPLTTIPTTPQEVLAALVTGKMTPQLLKTIAPIYAKMGIWSPELAGMFTGEDIGLREEPLNVFLTAKADVEAGKMVTRDQLAFALIEMCGLDSEEAFETIDRLGDEYGIDYFVRGAEPGGSLAGREY